jgi:hypothetical protein
MRQVQLPGQDRPAIFQRLLDFLQSPEAREVDCVANFVLICPTMIRMGGMEFLNGNSILAQKILENLDLLVYVELFVALMTEWPDEFLKNCGEPKEAYIRRFAALVRGDGKYEVSYNVFWAIQSLVDDSVTGWTAFREKRVFRFLLDGAIAIVNKGIEQNAQWILSFAYLSFRALANLVDGGDGPGSEMPELVEIAKERGSRFLWDDAVRKNPPLVTAVFPVLYKSGMHQTMTLLFPREGSDRTSSDFGSLYVKALNRLDSNEIVGLINAGLVEHTVKAIPIAREEGGKTLYRMPINFAHFSLAEKLCCAELLPFTETSLGREVKEIMKSREWTKLSCAVLRQRHFMKKEFDRAPR